MADSKKKKKKKTRSLHDQAQALMRDLRDVMSKMLDSNARLSDQKHRGPPCPTCKRPEANDAAHKDFTSDGDGPDLCWGYCSRVHD